MPLSLLDAFLRGVSLRRVRQELVPAHRPPAGSVFHRQAEPRAIARNENPVRAAYGEADGFVAFDPEVFEGPRAPQPLHIAQAQDRNRAMATHDALSANRSTKLKDKLNAASLPTVLPKDLTLQPTSFQMAAVSESTFVSGYGKVYGPGAGTRLDLMFAEQIARIGARHGVGVDLRTTPSVMDGLSAADGPVPIDWTNIRATLVPGREPHAFTQDSGEVHVDGSFSVAPNFGLPLKDIVNNAREERLGEELTRDFELIGTGAHATAARIELIALARERGIALHERQVYLEGGNVLTGTGSDGTPYALVGRDHVALAQRTLQSQHGGDDGKKIQVTEAQALQVISKDLGISAEKIFPVEQPDYHIDLNMSLYRPGEMILNDTRRATELEIGWMREDYEAARPTNGNASALVAWERAGVELKERIETLKLSSERVAKREDLALEDLSDKGLTIHRTAGVFGGTGQPMNFLNSVKGTDPHGKKFLICLGGDPRAEAFFLSELHRLMPDAIDFVYFLDRRSSIETLKGAAGAHCRVKPEGHVVPLTPELKTEPP